MKILFWILIFLAGVYAGASAQESIDKDKEKMQKGDKKDESND